VLDSHRARLGSRGTSIDLRARLLLGATAAALLAFASVTWAQTAVAPASPIWVRPTDPTADAPPPRSDTCLECHTRLAGRKVVHPAMKKAECTTCHQPTQRVGRCKSASASAWALTKPEAELCSSCHTQKDLGARFAVRHDIKGRCVACHDPHGSEQPKLVREGGRKLCLACHDARNAPPEVRPEKRIDFAAKVLHATSKQECQNCHEVGHGGASAKLLKRTQPTLCYECHQRKDQTPVVHTAIRMGECLECHAAHSSSVKGLLRRPREQVCLSCHEVEPLLSSPVMHAPVAEGRCLDCHNAHGGDRPAFTRGGGNAGCLACHDQGAPKGKGQASASKRVDLSRKNVHKPLKTAECSTCHDAGHGSQNPKLLRARSVDLCYRCHQRQDKDPFVHGAVVVGDCSGCHDPHSSDQPKLVAAATVKATCFRCHQDDVTGRKVLHAPVASGQCTVCHGPHGAKNRWLLKQGAGKQACYACHQRVDNGAVKHAALERYGCTACHDPHGTAERFLLPQKVNALCVGCHADQSDGRHVTSTSQRSHPVSAPSDPRKPDRAFTCVSCHNPHGSGSPKLLIRGKAPLDVCAACHGDKTGRDPDLKDIASRARREPTTAGSAGGGSGGTGGDAPGNGPTAPGVPGVASPAPLAPGVSKPR
jgi:predicted CXXCH cytochrome family protein